MYLGKNCCKITLASCSFPRNMLLMVTGDRICMRMRYWDILMAFFSISLAVWLHVQTRYFSNSSPNNQTSSSCLFYFCSYIKACREGIAMSVTASSRNLSELPAQCNTKEFIRETACEVLMHIQFRIFLQPMYACFFALCLGSLCFISTSIYWSYSQLLSR